MGKGGKLKKHLCEIQIWMASSSPGEATQRQSSARSTLAFGAWQTWQGRRPKDDANMVCSFRPLDSVDVNLAGSVKKPPARSNTGRVAWCLGGSSGPFHVLAPQSQVQNRNGLQRFSRITPERKSTLNKSLLSSDGCPVSIQGTG